MVPHSSDSAAAESDGLVDPLIEFLERAERATKPIAVRWILNAEVPFLAASVMLILEPEDAPLTAGEVAEAIGISVDDATRALHELRSLGYAREEKRRYEPTDKGSRAHESLARARRGALAAFASSMSEEERLGLVDALRSKAQG